MISLLTAGDIDILRDTVSPAAIFWHNLRNARLRVSAAAVLTALLLGVILLVAVQPQVAVLRWATREVLAVIVSFLSVVWLIYVGWLTIKLMPGRNDRVVIGLRKMVRSEIEPLEDRTQALSDDELRAKTAEFRQRLSDGESLDSIRPEAYACVREASRRARAHRQFECQLIGGKVLEDCNVAEMRTGEGKTIVCYMSNYMKVLQGLKVHMVTVNDYLVKRDADFCQPIFDLLNVSVGYITADMESYGPGARVRQEAYACDITYGTNSEFGFDYLRDNMKHNPRDQVQGPQDFTVVDEVDSILIDEARTPLIISGPAHDDVRNYQVADNIARSLIRKQEQANREMAKRINDVEKNAPPNVQSDAKFKDGIKKFRTDPFWLSSDEAEAIGHMQYFVVELDRKSAHMTEHGAKAAQAELGIGTFYDHKNMNWPHYIDNALRAHQTYQKDKEYVIQDGQIIIVDEFTGRLMHGRQWSDGLHQAVEAKERVTIKQESQTLATITLQNLFKLYRQLAGMTGTAMTESDEFMKIYKLEVIAIPTNQPVRRVDFNDKIYKSVTSKFDAIVEEIRGYSQNGYPADPWSLYDMLKQARKLLGQKLSENGQDAEAQTNLSMIEDALATFNDGQGDADPLEKAYLHLAGENVGGRPVLVGTVAVETSEKLSQLLSHRYGIEHEVLNAKNHAREAEIVMKAGQQHEVTRGKKKLMQGNVTIATNMAGRGTDIVLGPGVAQIGGLHVVGTERHESRRIDNQLRGRCGRQGDPGSSRFFLSFDDDLLRLFMGEWVLKMLTRFALEEGVPIEHRQLSKGIERAQKKVEERNFGIRKNLLEYDEVPDEQRRSFYEMRQRVLDGRNLSEFIWEMIDETVAGAVDRYYDPQYPAQCAAEWVGQNMGISIEAGRLDTSELAVLCDQVRDLATNEVRGTVQRTFGEYIDPDVPPDEWDVRGLLAWIAQYGLSFTQRQVREEDPNDLRDRIVEAALRKIEEQDLTPLEQYVDRTYARARLARWAQEKFGVAVPVEELMQASRDEAERILRDSMREAYRKREVEYPVGAVIEYALERGGTNINAVYEQIAKWANLKYRTGWTYEHFAGKNPQQIFQELTALNEDYMRNGRLDGEIDAAIDQHRGEAIVNWARQRFGRVVETSPIEPAAPDSDLREQLRRCGYEMLRYELTMLERMVLLTTFDSVWKDHMYAMDLLRHGIGLRGYAERDPKIEYKREGTRLFRESLSNIRERVTDLVFKVQVSVRPDLDDDALGGGVPARTPDAGGGAYAQMTTQHADATNVGFSSAAADHEAAMQKQGEAGKTQTIRRATPKVGRNDPCPCGSGKKYKHCHGKRG
jgi:preprotein translocase subunit SecA